MISSEFPTQINKNTLVLTGSFFNIKNCYFIMDLFSNKYLIDTALLLSA